ncbi:MAG TPA: LamG-like jellyroll fold domain-containing protein, partial [Pirellulaceae bacterium]
VNPGDKLKISASDWNGLLALRSALEGDGSSRANRQALRLNGQVTARGQMIGDTIKAGRVARITGPTVNPQDTVNAQFHKRFSLDLEAWDPEEPNSQFCITTEPGGGSGFPLPTVCDVGTVVLFGLCWAEVYVRDVDDRYCVPVSEGVSGPDPDCLISHKLTGDLILWWPSDREQESVVWALIWLSGDPQRALPYKIAIGKTSSGLEHGESGAFEIWGRLKYEEDDEPILQERLASSGGEVTVTAWHDWFRGTDQNIPPNADCLLIFFPDEGELENDGFAGVWRVVSWDCPPPEEPAAPALACYRSEGTDHVEIPTIAFVGAFSVAVRVSLDATISTAAIAGKSDGSDGVFALDDETVRVKIGGTSYDFAVPELGAGWYSLVVTRDEDDDLRVWLDGVESTTGEQAAAGTITFDRFAGDGTLALNGRLFDLRFCNGALSPAEIATIFSVGVMEVAGQVRWFRCVEGMDADALE